MVRYIRPPLFGLFLCLVRWGRRPGGRTPARPRGGVNLPSSSSSLSRRHPTATRDVRSTIITLRRSPKPEGGGLIKRKARKQGRFMEGMGEQAVWDDATSAACLMSTYILHPNLWTSCSLNLKHACCCVTMGPSLRVSVTVHICRWLWEERKERRERELNNKKLQRQAF